ncbi:sensor histidine kinase [Actinocorallia longicatena]|uniref:histidine kinase n=1 Tax=Actinocorallia longicatena TaxID=111803 RepID=A0ABP6QG70_9ACTN
MITTWQDRTREHPRLADAALALLLFAAAVPGIALKTAGVTTPGPWWPGITLAAVACAALLWRRTLPRAVTMVTISCATGQAALGFVLTVLLLGPLMAALYSLAVRTDRRTTRIFLLLAVLPVVDTALIAGPEQESIVLKTIGPIAWLVLPVALGSVTRLRRAYTEAVQARAEYAERTREEEARHRVAEERMRIARELHDVVAHHLALANAQAGTVAHLLRTHPDQAEKMVNELTGTTSAALREMKAVVGLLRQEDDPQAPLQPAPGLDQVTDLAASFASAGLTVTVAVQGSPRPVAPGVDVTGYRIVQEALTNVTKHAATHSAHVTLAYSDDLLSITITDDGQGTSRPGAESGYGVIGMRERAIAVGGRLTAGARPAGGFEVAADLPLPAPPKKEDLTA